MDAIVVGVDGSEAAGEAVQFAAAMAQATGATLTAVHVRNMPALVSPELVAENLVDDYLTAVESMARKTIEGVDAAFESRFGDPAEELERAAEDRGAGLIVVGRKGHGAMHRFLLGSVSTRLVHHSSIPVVVVPQPSTPPT
jgi:nucleotide-binding universal stress UspA family protein